jgi:hypothetical protein
MLLTMVLYSNWQPKAADGWYSFLWLQMFRERKILLNADRTPVIKQNNNNNNNNNIVCAQWLDAASSGTLGTNNIASKH